MKKLVNEYKTIFLEKQDKPGNFPKTFVVHWIFLWTCVEVCQKPKSDLQSHWVLVQPRKLPNLTKKTQTIFWQTKANIETFQKVFSYINVSSKYDFSHKVRQTLNSPKTFSQKQPSRRVLRKRCFENMQQIYRKTLITKCNFNKVAKQFYWARTLAWVFSCKLAVYFQSFFSEEHFWTAALYIEVSYKFIKKYLKSL